MIFHHHQYWIATHRQGDGEREKRWNYLDCLHLLNNIFLRKHFVIQNLLSMYGSYAPSHDNHNKNTSVFFLHCICLSSAVPNDNNDNNIICKTYENIKYYRYTSHLHEHSEVLAILFFLFLLLSYFLSFWNSTRWRCFILWYIRICLCHVMRCECNLQENMWAREKTRLACIYLF